MTPAANSSTPRLNRRAGVLFLLAAGAALLGLGAVPWVSGSANLPGSTLEKISSSGGQAAPIIPALGLVLLAAAVALALARRIGVIITCLITGAAGIATAVASGVVLNNPAGAMRSQVTETTAIVLPADAISAVTVTPWVIITGIIGLAITVLAFALMRTARHWNVDTRHEKGGSEIAADATAEAAEIPDADLWDLLSDGQDPTP